jgi:hypothetical protein
MNDPRCIYELGERCMLAAEEKPKVCSMEYSKTCSLYINKLEQLLEYYKEDRKGEY